MACCGGEMGDMGGMMAGMWVFGIVWLIVVVAALVVAFRLIGRAISERRPAADDGHDTALGTLRERFARGEIDAAEYEERRRVLGSRDTPA
ncbi:MAG: SHOCT domain-containing protein [Vicinamibacterales bacterium]